VQRATALLQVCCLAAAVQPAGDRGRPALRLRALPPQDRPANERSGSDGESSAFCGLVNALCGNRI
jgi:hypothetical protein